MLSPGSRARVEWVLRGIGVITLVLVIWQAWQALHQRPVRRAEGSGVRAALARWSTRESPRQVHVVLDSAPPPDVRDWLAALPATGTRTSWEGAALRPSAVAVEPVVDPRHPVRIWIAAPAGSGVVLRDSLGVIDSVALRQEGAVVLAPHVEGVVRMAVGGTLASAGMRDSLIVKPVLVLGVAGWEGKFIMASLEEHGWKVDARFSLSPGGDVIQGAATVEIDTARYATVIALDSSAAKYSGRIASFVRQGGGFIATGGAASLPAFASLLPASTGAMRRESVFEADSAHPRRTLAFTPLVRLEPDAVPVERRDAHAAVVARRLGTGRVLQVGYHDTWRWRMGGLGDPVPPYRAWWSAMVSSVAYAPRLTRAVGAAPAAAVEPTPLASLVGALGSPSTARAGRQNPLNDPRLLPVLFGVLMAAFLLEWTSRRLRGRP